jgi:hypothetical protein
VKHPLAGLIGQSSATVCTGTMNGYLIGKMLILPLLSCFEHQIFINILCISIYILWSLELENCLFFQCHCVPCYSEIDHVVYYFE